MSYPKSTEDDSVRITHQIPARDLIAREVEAAYVVGLDSSFGDVPLSLALELPPLKHAAFGQGLAKQSFDVDGVLADYVTAQGEGAHRDEREWVNV